MVDLSGWRQPEALRQDHISKNDSASDWLDDIWNFMMIGDVGVYSKT